MPESALRKETVKVFVQIRTTNTAVLHLYLCFPGTRFRLIDLLHPVRRRYRGELPDCKLSTVEREVLGRPRDRRDIPGAEAPLRFLDYQETGETRHLEPIIEHNRIDLTTLVMLYPLLEG